MKERTLLLIKPDGVKRGKAGEIIARFEKVGLKIVGLKMVRFTKELAEQFYPKEMEKGLGEKTASSMKEEELKEVFGASDTRRIGKQLRSWLIEFIQSGPCIAIVLEGYNAIEAVRKIVGGTNPLKAEPGTIRGDYTSIDYRIANFSRRAVRNLVHASDSEESARKEIELLFSPEELHSYERAEEKEL